MESCCNLTERRLEEDNAVGSRAVLRRLQLAQIDRGSVALAQCCLMEVYTEVYTEVQQEWNDTMSMNILESSKINVDLKRHRNIISEEDAKTKSLLPKPWTDKGLLAEFQR